MSNYWPINIHVEGHTEIWSWFSHSIDKGAVILCNLSGNFVATQVASQTARCNIVLYNKSLQESLHEVESDSTFRNDADNAEMHFFLHCTVTSTLQRVWQYVFWPANKNLLFENTS